MRPASCLFRRLQYKATWLLSHLLRPGPELRRGIYHIARTQNVRVSTRHSGPGRAGPGRPGLLSRSQPMSMSHDMQCHCHWLPLESFRIEDGRTLAWDGNLIRKSICACTTPRIFSSVAKSRTRFCRFIVRAESRTRKSSSQSALS